MAGVMRSFGWIGCKLSCFRTDQETEKISKKNISDEFQAKLSADMIVLNKFKRAEMCTLFICIIR